jgi:hypothetical protein
VGHDFLKPLSTDFKEDLIVENDINKRITVLEDIEAIKNLKSLYCYLADAGINGDASKLDELMTHFTDDARIDFGQADAPDIHEGKAAVTKFYKDNVCEALSYSAHLVANPIIEVNGNNAKGRWYVFVPCTIRGTNTASWLFGKYEEVYVKMNGQWKWSSMIFRAEFNSPFEGEGWIKKQ